MIIGVHALLYNQQAEEVRAFFRDVLGLGSIDAGGGWPIFGLPPAELAVHPTEGEGSCALYLLCDDLQATMAELAGKGVTFARPVHEERWGSVTAIALPSGAELGLYQPRHPLALGLSSRGDAVP
jgi:hypothetical protein